MTLTLIAAVLPRASADTSDGVTSEASQFQALAGASTDGGSGGVTDQVAPPSPAGGAGVSTDPELEESTTLTADASQQLDTQPRPAGEADEQGAAGTQDPQRPAGSPPVDAGGCTTGGGCPDVPASPQAPPLVAAVPSGPPSGPDEPTSDDQPSGEQPSGEQPGAWVSSELGSARTNPDYLSQFDRSQLEDQLQALDEVTAGIPADSQLAVDAAALRALYSAELQRRPAAETSPGEPAGMSPEEIAEVVETMREAARGVGRLLDAMAPLQGTLDPHEAERAIDEGEQALNALDRTGQPRTELTILAVTLNDLLDVVHEEQIPPLAHLLGRVEVERAAYALLDAIPPGTQEGPLPALRQSVLDQIRSDGGVQLPSDDPYTTEWASESEVPPWVNPLLDVAEAVIDDRVTWQRPVDELEDQALALGTLRTVLPAGPRMVRLAALSNRLHAIIEVAGDRPGAAGGGHDDESLLLAVLEHELQAARDEFEDEDTDRHPGRTDQTLEQVLATVQRTVRDAPPGSGLADQAAALEREVRDAIAQGPLLSVNLNDPAVAGVPPSKPTSPPGVGLPGFTLPPKLPDKWVFIPPAVKLPAQTVFIPPAVDQRLLHLQ